MVVSGVLVFERGTGGESNGSDGGGESMVSSFVGVSNANEGPGVGVVGGRGGVLMMTIGVALHCTVWGLGDGVLGLSCL